MSHKTNLIIDVIAAVVYVVAAFPLNTGWTVHEYVSLGLLVVLIVHCATHYDWIIATLKKRSEAGSWGNLILDIVTLVVFVVVLVSGLMVSRIILPSFGFVAAGYFFWAPLHSVFAKILLALLISHIVLHWRWFWSLLPKGKKRGKEEYQTVARYFLKLTCLTSTSLQQFEILIIP